MECHSPGISAKKFREMEWLFFFGFTMITSFSINTASVLYMEIRKTQENTTEQRLNAVI